VGKEYPAGECYPSWIEFIACLFAYVLAFMFMFVYVLCIIPLGLTKSFAFSTYISESINTLCKSMHTYIHTYMHTYIHACMHACMHIMWIYDRSRLLPIQDGGAG
jgi:hypothetical protein